VLGEAFSERQFPAFRVGNSRKRVRLSRSIAACVMESYMTFAGRISGRDVRAAI